MMYGGADWNYENDAALIDIHNEDHEVERECEICGEPAEVYVYRTTAGDEYPRDRCYLHAS